MEFGISCAQQPLPRLLCHSRERHNTTQHNHLCQLMSEAINIWHKMPQYSHHSHHPPTHSWQTEFRCYIITFHGCIWQYKTTNQAATLQTMQVTWEPRRLLSMFWSIMVEIFNGKSKKNSTWASHHGVLSALKPGQMSEGQGPFAIKESLEVVCWLLIPRGLNIYRGEAA